MFHFSNHHSSRRGFLSSAAAVCVGFVAGLPFGRAMAQTGANHPGTSLPHLSPSDPLAQSLGYTENASKVDKARFPNYKPGERCEKCRFFQGTPGQQYGPCQIFAGKAVNAGGWCASFNAKA